jgi:hypothetical protein
LLALAGCGDASADRNAGPYFDPWIEGGQTGSLMPLCGAREESVPASSEGFVVYTGQCVGVAFSPTQLMLRGPDGSAIPFEVQNLNNGAFLITPEHMLMPGTYTFGNGSDMLVPDEDAGIDDDGGVREAPLEPMGPPIMETVVIAPAAPMPTSFGNITRVGETCSPTFELQLDPATAAHTALLALDIQIDGEPVRPFIKFGTLEVSDGFALVTLPEDLWLSLEYGAHTLTWVVRIAGQEAALAVISMPLDMACVAQPSAPVEGEESTGLCALAKPRTRSIEGFVLALAALLLALRRRKRS